MAVKLPFSPGISHFLYRLNPNGGLFGYYLKRQTSVTPSHSPSRGRKGDRQAGVKIIGSGFNDGLLDTAAHRRNWFDWHWMNDLMSIGTPEAQEIAFRLAYRWCHDFSDLTNGKINPDVCTPSSLAHRICEWIYCHRNFLSMGNQEELEEINQIFAFQIFILATQITTPPKEFDGLIINKALILCCLLNLLEDRNLTAYEDELQQFITHHQLPDGGVISRNPEQAATLLEDLTDLRVAYLDAGQQVPGFLQQAIDRTAAFLKFLEFSDHRLPHFQGAENRPGFKLSDILSRSGFTGAAALSAPHSGYTKVTAGDTELILDSGNVPSLKEAKANFHASIASFELYLDKQPVIINCGDVSTDDPDWIMAQRSSSAHSTAILAETNQISLTKTGVGSRIANVKSSHDKSEEGNLVSIQHDGYVKNWGFLHHRQIFVFKDGEDIRGLDEIKTPDDLNPNKLVPQNYKIRFHLHPTIQVSMLQSGNAALLKLPDGQGWRLRSNGVIMKITDSYFCDLGIQRATKQIMLAGLAKPGLTSVKWALQRES